MLDAQLSNYLERITVALEKIAKVVDKFNETKIKVKPKSIFPPLNEHITPFVDKSKPGINKDAWVLEPYNICITTMPPKYLTRIFHYHDPKGLCEWALQRGPNTQIFYTKTDALNYCKTLGSEYEIVDIPVPQTVVIGDDYE